MDLKVPDHIIREWNLDDGTYEMQEILEKGVKGNLRIKNGSGQIAIDLGPLESNIFRLKSE